MIWSSLKNIQEFLEYETSARVVMGEVDFSAQEYPIINLKLDGEIDTGSIWDTGGLIEYSVPIDIMAEKGNENFVFDIFEEIIKKVQQVNSLGVFISGSTEIRYDENLFILSTDIKLNLSISQ